MWVDIGSWRWTEHPFRRWPDPQKVQSAFMGKEDKVLMGLIMLPGGEAVWNIGNPTQTSKANILFEGTFFAGSAEAVQWLEAEFYSLHNLFLEAGAFVGDDQELLAAVLLKNHQHVMLLDVRNGSPCYDPWFVFQLFFGADHEASTSPKLANCEVPRITFLKRRDSFVVE